MTMQRYSTTLVAVAGAIIAFVPLAIAKTPTGVNVGLEARKTIRSMRELATTAAQEAVQLGSYSKNATLSPDVHRAPLMALKQEINTMGKEIGSLEAANNGLEPWERQALDRVLPLLKDAAANTERAVEDFNSNRNHLWSANYGKYTKTVERDSTQIARTLATYLKYEKVREQEQHLQSAIEGGSN